MNKKILKKLKRALARWAYYFFFWLFGILPLKFIFAISNSLIAIVFPFLLRMRAVAKESLTIAFGQEKSQKEIDHILRTCFFNLGRGAIEMLCYVQRPQLVTEKLYLSPGSRENLDNALIENKGVMGISAHLGNFPLMLLSLAQQGYPVNAIIRPLRYEKIEKSFQKQRAKLGLKTIHSYPREACVKQSLKALRAKELVVVLMDQNTSSESGVFVDFFGKKAYTSTGAVVFAMRTGAPLLPIFTVRDGKDSHKIIIEPHLYVEEKSSEEETLAYNVQKLTAIIEKYIHQYPQEWSWMHRRWKSKEEED